MRNVPELPELDCAGDVESIITAPEVRAVQFGGEDGGSDPRLQLEPDPPRPLLGQQLGDGVRVGDD